MLNFTVASPSLDVSPGLFLLPSCLSFTGSSWRFYTTFTRDKTVNYDRTYIIHLNTMIARHFAFPTLIACNVIILWILLYYYKRTITQRLTIVVLCYNPLDTSKLRDQNDASLVINNICSNFRAISISLSL